MIPNRIPPAEIVFVSFHVIRLTTGEDQAQCPSLETLPLYLLFEASVLIASAAEHERRRVARLADGPDARVGD